MTSKEPVRELIQVDRNPTPGSPDHANIGGQLVKLDTPPIEKK